jgi:hypothetical protein
VIQAHAAVSSPPEVWPPMYIYILQVKIEIVEGRRSMIIALGKLQEARTLAFPNLD